jgi:hypothetical protein
MVVEVEEKTVDFLFRVELCLGLAFYPDHDRLPNE